MFDLLIALSPFGAFLGYATVQVAGPAIKNKIALSYHKYTEGKHLADRETMEMVLQSLREFPSEWKINETSAQFPKQGSYKIAISRENGGMQLSLPSDDSGGRFRNVSPYFEVEVQKILDATAAEAKRKIVERTLFPDGMPLMIGNK